jgi:hypothetical protein
MNVPLNACGEVGGLQTCKYLSDLVNVAHKESVSE